MIKGRESGKKEGKATEVLQAQDSVIGKLIGCVQVEDFTRLQAKATQDI